MALNPWKYSEADSEHAHQAALFMWLSMAKKYDERFGLMFAIPNGGERARAVASRLKAEGVKSGVPDTFLPVPIGSAHGLFIEMKKPKSSGKRSGVVSGNQIEWANALIENGYQYFAAFDWKQARDCVLWYLYEKDTTKKNRIKANVWVDFKMPGPYDPNAA